MQQNGTIAIVNTEKEGRECLKVDEVLWNKKAQETF